MYQRSSDGLLGIYKKNGAWLNTGDCGDSSRVILLRNNSSRSEFYSALLAAKLSNNEIGFFLSGCTNWNGITYPAIIGLDTY